MKHHEGLEPILHFKVCKSVFHEEFSMMDCKNIQLFGFKVCVLKYLCEQKIIYFSNPFFVHFRNKCKQNP